MKKHSEENCGKFFEIICFHGKNCRAYKKTYKSSGGWRWHKLGKKNLIFKEIHKTHEWKSTNQNISAVAVDNQRATGVTRAGAGTTDATGADVAWLNDRGEGEIADRVCYHVQVDIAQELSGRDAAS